ncbi:MAG: site-2 protease family protein [Candidatus Sumerlaeaceae bacterium]|nr:site-2 protease family protein [Candidatus Sumerlaeaceae bacterium]
MEFLRGIFGIVFLFSVAIFVHEFGHFFFAKLFGVGVETFSIGFGKKLWRRRWGDTEYCISAIPFGGYVKLRGILSKEVESLLDDQGADKADADKTDSKPHSLSDSVMEEVHALRSKAYWQKLLIFSGGCINNLLTAAVVFFLMGVVGFDAPAPIPAEIEKVDPAVAEQVELRAGDTIHQVGETTVSAFGEFLSEFSRYALAYKARSVPLTITRDNTSQPLLVRSWLIPNFSPDTDRLVEVDGQRVRNISAAARLADRASGQKPTVPVKIARSPASAGEEPTGGGVFGCAPMPQKSPPEIRELDVHAIAAAGPLWPALACEPRSSPFIGMVLPNLPAERAGLQTGDTIVAIDGVPIATRLQATETIRRALGREIEVLVKRRTKDGADKLVSVRVPVRPDPEKPNRGQIGIVFSQPLTERFHLPPPQAAVYAFSRVWAISIGYLVTVGDILRSSFQTVRENIGGPVAISRFGYDAAKRGWKWFFDFFAMFNIILAITNLLPLPVFDGGHILFATIEAVARRPLPAWLLARIYQAFIILLIALAVAVTLNDILMNSWRLL